MSEARVVKRTNFSLWLILYSGCFSFFGIMPALITSVWKSPITWGDALDFLTPLAVIPVALALFLKIQAQPSVATRSLGVKVIATTFFILGLILYIEGHGIHLPSNSISRLMDPGTPVYKAAYLFDEVISHYIWDSGVITISIGLILLAAPVSFQPMTGGNYFLIFLGAALYGFTYICNGIEGQTVPLTFPTAIIGTVASSILYFKSKKAGRANPVLLFFSLGYLVSTILFAYWGISHPGFPEFSAIGWID